MADESQPETTNGEKLELASGGAVSDEHLMLIGTVLQWAKSYSNAKRSVPREEKLYSAIARLGLLEL